MYIILGIFVTFFGIFMLAAPRAFFGITESWKNSGDAEPSKRYIINTRARGVIFLLVGVVGTLILILA